MATWEAAVRPDGRAGFERLVDGAWTGWPQEITAMAGPLMAMMTQMGSMAFGSQLGQALGRLSREVLTSTDIGLPLGPPGWRL